MQLHFTEESFKEHTKMMLAYLKEQGYDIPLGKGYEATSRFCGAKSWNVVASQLKGDGVGNLPVARTSTTPVYLYEHVLTTATVKAYMHTDDYVFDIEFDAVEYFKDIEFSTLVNLMAEGWGGCEEADEIGRYFDDTNEDVKAAFQYLRQNRGTGRACGFEVSIEEGDVMTYLRAFRNDDYVRLILVDAFGTEALEDAPGWVINGYGVVPDVDAKSLDIKWLTVFNSRTANGGSSSEKLAWEVLGAKMEAADRFGFFGPESKKVKPNSGRWE